MIYRKVGEYSYHTIFSHFILMQFRLKKMCIRDSREYLAEVLPTFDRARVHVGDIKKLISWYNTLISNGLTEFKPEAEVGEEEVVAE